MGFWLQNSSEIVFESHSSKEQIYVKFTIKLLLIWQDKERRKMCVLLLAVVVVIYNDRDQN